MSQFIENTYDHRYSRQSYTIGNDAQTKLSNATILVIGYNALSQEIIRNMALIGVAKIDIYCNTKIKQKCSQTNLYYKMIDDLVPLNDLKKLNPTINIECVDILDEDNELDKKKIIKYNLIILTNSVIDDALNINRITHKFNVPFIMCGTYGLMGYVFNDFGDKFEINDIDGDNEELLILDSIDGKILKFKDEHKLFKDDIIIINDTIELKVCKKKSPLIIELTTIPSQNKNDYCKILRKKISQTFNFESLKKNILNPLHIVSDSSVGIERSNLLHKLHMIMDKYLNEFNELPKPWSICDWEVFSDKYLNKFDIINFLNLLKNTFKFII